jgi:hypothetical protein
MIIWENLVTQDEKAGRSQWGVLPSISGASSTCSSVTEVLHYLCCMTTHAAVWQDQCKIFWHSRRGKLWNILLAPWTQVSCDFDMFPKKESVRGKWFCCVEKVMQAVGQTLASINTNRFTDVINCLPQIWDKDDCMVGDYTEGIK